MNEENYTGFLKRKILTACLVVAMALSLITCRAPENSTSADTTATDTTPSTPVKEVTTTNYAGAGSAWTTALRSDNTFTITRAPGLGSSTVDLTVNGTYSTLSSGFLKLLISDATGTNAPAAGDIAYALNVPGFAFFLKPMGATGEIITMITSGTCPATDFDSNFITEKSYSATGIENISTNPVFGSLHYNAATTEITLPTGYSLDSLYTGRVTHNPGTSTCSNGTMTLGNGATTINMWLTAMGGAIVQIAGDQADSTYNNTLVGVPVENYLPSNLAGNYSGLYFGENAGVINNNTAGATDTMSATINADATSMSVDRIIGEAGTPAGSPVSLAITSHNNPSAGFFKATLGSSTVVICTANTNVAGSGKKMIFCSGNDTSNTSVSGGNLTNLLLISR